MSSVNNVALPNVQSSRLYQESQVDMTNVVQDPKATRIAGQNQDNVVNLATSQTQASSEDNKYAHQHHIALNAYLGRDPKQKEQVQQSVKAIEHGIGTEGNQGTKMQQDAKQAPMMGDSEPSTGAKEANGKEEKDDNKVGEQSKKGINGKELTEQEQQEVRDMQARDKEVRIHEQAHKSAGGQYAAAPSYTYETGPDGKRYITDGEVSIDIGEEDDPQATIDKMQVVKRAALAPQEPSPQDRRVYAEASQKEAQARQELAKEKAEGEDEESTNTSGAGSASPAKAINGHDEKSDQKDGPAAAAKALDKIDPPKASGSDIKNFED